MKCPGCVAEDAKSILREDHLREPKKGALIEKFWDEDGRKHVHDHTLHRMILSCSRGHAYQQRLKGRCPQADCAWNQQPEVIAQSLPIGFQPLPATPSPSGA